MRAEKKGDDVESLFSPVNGILLDIRYRLALSSSLWFDIAGWRLFFTTLFCVEGGRDANT
jgi:hypothetical protein